LAPVPSWETPIETEQETRLPTGEVLRQLFRAIAADDREGLRAAAVEIVAEERGKNHRLLADDLTRLLANGAASSGRAYPVRAPVEVPKDRERGFPLLDLSYPDESWARLVLPRDSADALLRVAEENRRRDVLAAASLAPTQKILFFGPPGCGKTLAARVLASELGLALVTVRLDAVVSSYLGETAANLRRVFDFVGRDRWVVLFDEFDALGKDRDNPLEHGELKRVVNALLQLMDGFGGDSLLIAATNHEKLLDTGIWRRFEAVVEFPLPKQQDRVLLLRQFLSGFGTKGLSMERIARSLTDASGADIERVAVEAARHAVLRGSRGIDGDDIRLAVKSFTARRAQLAQYRDSPPRIDDAGGSPGLAEGV
jgi:hypothetical protein